MTIRLWLRLAECRLCGTQVELTEEQERLAQELLEKRDGGVRPPSAAAAKAPPVFRPAWSRPVAPPPAPPPPLIAVPVADPTPAMVAVPVMPARAVAAPLRYRRGVDRDWLELLLSGLISLLVHMALIVALGLWFYEKPKAATLILRATFEVQQAGPKGKEDADPTRKKSPPPPMPVVVTPEKVDQPSKDKRPLLDAKSLVDKLIVDPSTPTPNPAIGGHVQPGTMFENRDPRVREQVVRREGGSNQTERAVAMGLKWLAAHQNTDGSWSLHRFHQAGDCDGQCSRAGAPSDTAATALAVLPFLGAGYTHQSGGYRQVVKGAVDWLIADQRSDGSFASLGAGRMYAHGQAAIALCEAYALTRDRELLEPAQRAIDYIVAAQHPAGGWRYRPRQEGDLSVTGWEVMALQSAKTAYLVVPDAVLKRVDAFLDSVQTSTKIGTFAYLPGDDRTPAMTAEGLLCRQYRGWKADHGALLEGADYLLNEHLPDYDDVNLYYWYYATQVMHHIGGPRWTRWNDHMKTILVDLQDETGHEAGSWAPQGRHDTTGGRVYMTALAVCTLEVYYRHLPLYRTNDVTRP